MKVCKSIVVRFSEEDCDDICIFKEFLENIAASDDAYETILSESSIDLNKLYDEVCSFLNYAEDHC